MSMLEAVTSCCAAMFQQSGTCRQCTHPSGRCSGSCRDCSRQVNFHEGGRTDYDCQKFIYYYMCRYSWKYCSEILYALDKIDFSCYPAYSILSLGCGGAPDLMAFESCIPETCGKSIAYTGYDANPYWAPVHMFLNGYAQCRGISARFGTKNIFDVLADGTAGLYTYNIIIMEYLLSHFQPENRYALVEKLFEGLITRIVENPFRACPVLFLFNEIDHYSVTCYYDIFLQILMQRGHDFTTLRLHFSDRREDYNDGSFQYESARNKFSIPETIKTNFDCAIRCTSAQLIVEVK